jgi:hypothetical protein
VTVSAMSVSSSSLCVMKRIAVPWSRRSRTMRKSFSACWGQRRGGFVEDQSFRSATSAWAISTN